MKIPCLFLLFIITSLGYTAYAEWTLWVVPESRSVDTTKPLKFVYGVTGGGYLDPQNLKVTLYSEADSMLKKENGPGEYESYSILFPEGTPTDIFQKNPTDLPSNVNKTILLDAEQRTPFDPMYVTPNSPGDKKVRLVMSYKDNNGNWHSTSEEFSYHANSFAEKYETYGFVIAIITALIGIWKDSLKNILSKIKGKFVAKD
ncbi:MAG: hypothetical protein AB1499_15435 [Nitrospirota bacterium]